VVGFDLVCRTDQYRFHVGVHPQGFLAVSVDHTEVDSPSTSTIQEEREHEDDEEKEGEANVSSLSYLALTRSKKAAECRKKDTAFYFKCNIGHRSLYKIPVQAPKSQHGSRSGGGSVCACIIFS
jgi:hypothetical protein